MLDSGRSVVVAKSDAGYRDDSSAAGGADDHGGEPRARAAGARKPGVIGKTIEHTRSAVESIQLPRLDWKAFAWGLLIIIVLAFIIRNWSPLRINFFGLYFDAPRAVVLIIMFVLGMMTAWLLEVRSRRKETDAIVDEVTAADNAPGEPAAGTVDEPVATEPVVEEGDLFPEDYYETEDAEFDSPEDSAAPDED